MIPADKTAVASLTGAMGPKVDEWAVWYSGDIQRITNHYADFLQRTAKNGRFYAQLYKEERSEVVHEPLASDIAQVSSNMLFSEPADIQYDDAGRSGDRITSFIDDNRFGSKLLEGAELCAAMGGVYLKMETNPDLSDVPMLIMRTPEMAITNFKSGKLQGVTFWDIIGSDDNDVFRLFESRTNRHGDLVIEYGLFKGTRQHIGRKIDLGAFEETAAYQDVVYPNFGGLGCVYIPNQLPNRLYPGSPQGISDIADCISLLDSLDETMTSWIRDLTLGQARIFADQELFNTDIPTNPNYPSVSGIEKGSSVFDPFQRIYQKLDMSGWKLEGGSAKPIDQVQFDIRVDEHSRTANELIEKIISRSGYAPQSFGLNIHGRADSGTALRMRERKSFMTQRKKSKYWAPALDDLFLQMQKLDQMTRLSGSYEIQDVSVVPADSIINDASETATTIKDLKAAEAISTYMSVKMANPDWDEDAINEEVQRINEEKGAMPSNMIGG